jgi:hypothetical protein
MSVLNGTKIIAPVSTDDVYAVTGCGTHDIGEQCRFAGNNKWSRYKPFISSDQGYDTIAEQEVALIAANFGLSSTPYQPSTGLDLLAWLKVTQNWDYPKPSDNLRLLDFEEYEHNAPAPLPANGTIAFQRSVSSREISIGYNIAGGDDAIGITEMTALANYYIGMILKRTGSTNRYIITSSSKIGVGGMSFILSNAAPFNIDAEWEYNVICSSVPFTTITAFTDNADIAYTPSFLPAPFACIEDGTGTLNVYYPASEIEIEVIPLIDSATSYTLSLGCTSNGKVNNYTVVRITAIQMTNSIDVWESYSLTSPLDVPIREGSISGIDYVDNGDFSTILRLVSGRKVRAAGFILSGDDLDLSMLETYLNF